MVSPVTLYSLWPVLPVRLATTCPPATPIGRPTRADKSGSRPIWPARSSWPARHRCCAQVERRRPPMAQSPDVLLDAIFDLARRLGLGDHFFAGDVEAAWRHQLDPSGLTLAQLRANLVGVKADLATNYRKYASLDPSTGKPRGFPTPSRTGGLLPVCRGWLRSPAVPQRTRRKSAQHAGAGARLPARIDSFRLLQFVDQQHRNNPRLRNDVGEPFVEIHSKTARAARARWRMGECRDRRGQDQAEGQIQ